PRAKGGRARMATTSATTDGTTTAGAPIALRATPVAPRFAAKIANTTHPRFASHATDTADTTNATRRATPCSLTREMTSAATAATRATAVAFHPGATRIV